MADDNDLPRQSPEPLFSSNDAHPADGVPESGPAEVDASHTRTQASQLIDEVIYSDIGVATLLQRLKQSIASARDFAAFLKKRSILEEEYAQGLKKLCKSTHESFRRPEHRQGSFAQQNDEMIRIFDRMSENGIQFVLSLHQMQEDLSDMTSNIERGRKPWKQTGLSAEKRAQDSENLMEKAKAKYDSLAEDYDRVRTGDKQSGKIFGLKGPKSAAQHEEDLLKKVQAADTDYASKVNTARAQRQELITTLRPQSVRALMSLISECDAGLTLQLQKFASLNEKLLLNNGLSLSPLKQQEQSQDAQPRSLREAFHLIDNDGDLNSYILSFLSKVPPKRPEINYERHLTLAGQQPMSTAANRQSQLLLSSPSGAGSAMQTAPQLSTTLNTHVPLSGSGPDAQSPVDRSLVGAHQPQYPGGSNGVTSLPGPSSFQPTFADQTTPGGHSAPYPGELPPLKPVFGVSLDELFRRDGSAVPMVVYQCLQAVDLFGLDLEGIYRLSGTASHIAKLKAIFDNDSSQVDFRNPENFFHDVNSVAGLLKQFFRDLPEPLMTTEHYAEFINAARVDDDIIRRDSLHAIVNSLPDPNYATLRALIIHLNRVQEHSHVNRMNAGNLAICFGPTLMGSNTGPNIADAGWQVRVIDTILQNTYQIFDDD
ncbi:rho GTPase activator [Xylona heveae TC161]|uniref:Rho GTPase activator n=1 Tax=Xylona heveae (strain CBS 132557 / TC161) TaxID=1328760 RepID=A0A165AHY1_XYLHT|nr:rho GTPase activator [Xylona heveae TC161]KZF20504.1 rho GTPase activator [Xylona heveae TC161]